MGIEELRLKVENPDITWVKNSGIYAEVVEERHIKMILPAKDHLNHVGTVYAGSIFMAMEFAGGGLFFATYGMDKYAPIVKKVEVDYLKPTNTDLVIDLKLSEEEALSKIKPVMERGKGDWILEIPLSDAAGNVLAKARINYFIIPMTKDFMMKK
jgi:acyl-coenzyme A thioesterase PaaI-like protein